MEMHSNVMKMRFFISVAVTILLSMSAMAQSGIHGTLSWSLDSNGTLSINGPGVVYANGPWAAYKDKVKTIIIGDEVTEIGMVAFGGYSVVTSVYIGRGVGWIDCFPFADCPNFAEYVIDEANLYWASVSGMLLDKAKTEIWDCPMDKKGDFIIPSTVVTLGNGTFAGNQNLTSITIPGNVKIIEDGVFQGCFNLKSVIMGEGVEVIGAWGFQNSGITSITLPNSVTTIGDYAFRDCAIPSINLPNNLISIGKYAFSWTELTSITIPKNVSSIGTGAFIYCYYLTNINVDKDNAYFTSENNILFNKDKSRLMEYLPGKLESTYTIPSSVNIIDDYAFNNLHLTSITIPQNTNSIGSWAFGGCLNLSTVTVNWIIPFATNEDVYDEIDPDNGSIKVIIPIFNTLDISKIHLSVPAGTAAAYRAAPVWKNFGSITEREAVVTIHAVSSEPKIYITGNTLYLNTPANEMISIYSPGGSLLYHGSKQEGEIHIPLHSVYDKLLIVRGSSGWVQKVITKQ